MRYVLALTALPGIGAAAAALAPRTPAASADGSAHQAPQAYVKRFGVSAGRAFERRVARDACGSHHPAAK